jgi:hypothetical protein
MAMHVYSIVADTTGISHGPTFAPIRCSIVV